MNLNKDIDNTTEKQWYYLDANNANKGPFQQFALHNFFNEKIIHAHTYIWSEGMPTWVKYQEIFTESNISPSPIPPVTPLQNPFLASPPPQNHPQQRMNSSTFTPTEQNISPDLKYILFSFSGRLRRRNYWMTYLFICIAVAFILFISALIHEYLTLIAIVVGFIPLMWIGLAISIKRLHDINLSGWYLLLCLIPYVGGLILLVMYLLPSTQGQNNYGPQP